MTKLSQEVPQDVQHALSDWYSALEFLLTPHVRATTNRIDFTLLNDRWPAIVNYPSLPKVVSLNDGFLTHAKSECVASLAYPVLLISDAVLRREYQQPFYRLLDERGFLGGSGVMILGRALEACFEQTMRLLELLCATEVVPKIEIVLLRDRLYEYVQYHPSRVQELSELERQYQLGEIEHFDYRYIGHPTTSTKGIKNLVDVLLGDELSVSLRCAALIRLRGLLDSMVSSKITRLMPTLTKLEFLFEDPHPMVRDLYWVCINYIAKLMFENSLSAKPEICYEYLTKLVDKAINLDLNLAQKSVVESVLGLDAEAEETWQLLLSLAASEELILPEVVYHHGTLYAQQWREATRDFLKGQGVLPGPTGHK